jgi:hypothetical protein
MNGSRIIGGARFSTVIPSVTRISHQNSVSSISIGLLRWIRQIRYRCGQLAADGVPIVALSVGRDVYAEDGGLAVAYRLGDACAVLVQGAPDSAVWMQTAVFEPGFTAVCIQTAKRERALSAEDVAWSEGGPRDGCA